MLSPNRGWTVWAILLPVAWFAWEAPAAAIVFDDFDVDVGHFDKPPSTSTSNSNLSTSSTAGRVTDQNVNTPGAGALRLGFKRSTGVATRVRFLSGGGSPGGASGSPANTPFTTSDTTADGFIGLYLKTTASGWTVQIALDGPSDLQGGVPRAVITDGEWHLYEWNLDLAADWGAVSSIGGDSTFDEGTQSIDSVVFRAASSAPADSTLYMDFVAKSDGGSIQTIVPEPSLGFAALFGLVAMAVRRNRPPHPRP